MTLSTLPINARIETLTPDPDPVMPELRAATSRARVFEVFAVDARNDPEPTAVWLMLFDRAADTPPSPGDKPMMPAMKLKGCVATYAWDGTESAVYVEHGLWVALSSYAWAYTPQNMPSFDFGLCARVSP